MVYLSKSKLNRHIKRANKIIEQLKINLGKEWKIKCNLVGSASRNLVIPTNNGFDFDYHIHLIKYPTKLSPKQIKDKIRTTLNRIVKKYTLGPCEDSTHVLTSKKIQDGKVLYSYDFAILRKSGVKAEILKNRKNGKPDDYQFVQNPNYPLFIKNLDRIKDPNHVNYLRDTYYKLKIKEQNIKKDDRTLSINLLSMAINKTIQKYRIK